MSDQELDDLFKEASGSQNTPYDASDWQKMETLLDGKASVRSPLWNWKRYSWAIVLFVTSVALIELWSIKLSDNVIPEKPAQVANENTIVPLSERSSVSAKLEDVENTNEDVSDDNENLKINADKRNASVTEKRALAAEKKNKNEFSVIIAHEKSPIEKRKLDYGRNDIKSMSTNEGVEENVGNKSEAMTGESVNPESKKTDTQQISLSSKDKEISQKDSLDILVLAEAAATDSIKNESLKEENKSIENNRSFSLKLALSPDFSSVGYFTPGKTGFNYGLIAEYALGKHLSISAGGIWSKKLYTYRSIENNSYGQVLNGKTIDGDCRILDVPLNVNYYFNPGHRFTIYGSLGVSSYIMFSEDYNYDVVKNGSSYDYAIHVARKNNEWFKMTNISLGLQYRLRNRLALQIEPFVKAPLSGIGEGNYKLVSSGAFLNIKYTFK